MVPLFNRRTFHYAQPFDYSGIEWGWIHVGLSLKGYDQSVTALYRNTILLALGCAALSLIVSLLYAGKLVRPILRLRELVRQIAGGDLSVRTDLNRHDELGSLAESVNVMTEALLRRDHILESVRFAAQKFMQTSRWQNTIDSVLEKIGQAADADRAYIFKNHLDEAGRLCTSLRFEWVQGVDPQLSNPDLQNLPYIDTGFAHWISVLGNNDIISGPVSKMSPAERTVLEPQGIRSLIVIPVFVEGIWWGILGLDDCVRDREWTEPEKDSLRAGADMLGATIVRQRTQEALLEAKATLEQRVQERTKELETQVNAKEEALTELAAVQGSLVEVSRAAGMAEVATGVLHNVGNVLNSVNVSCTLIRDQLRESRVDKVARVAGMIAESGDDLGRFFVEDPRGAKIPAYLTALATALQEEHHLMSTESEALHDRIEHIKEIVTMQQTYGRVSGVFETISPDQLMEDALKLNADELTRNEVTVQRQYKAVPPITVDKHKVLQILLNLINNAKHACTDGGSRTRNMTLRIFNSNHGRLAIQVSDNGMGIVPENLTRIFHHGFTTRKSGHGFGLHSGALAARELGGSLIAESDGPGLGATFTLELPCHLISNPDSPSAISS
ncbi:putative sensory box histidine kinase/response regulator [Desulforapulum autotrophicum HRM2]|uniref:histidine kinase n=1 Tax=Desulforapulum autotrophicum (strain ATCC 43914 / DSM 3382 / VKM B-1955 / HRM2) TaxID=177437 RepID=C0QA97_DESAH|nr:ATP-binding protein [Desulforapulum autotrophicum]ACN14682.1 putative sensory box histidine kinase/response regulator [Desulforapulum autotrophicum HRM2]